MNLHPGVSSKRKGFASKGRHFFPFRIYIAFHITKIRLYSCDPLKPPFYTVKLYAYIIFTSLNPTFIQ